MRIFCHPSVYDVEKGLSSHIDVVGGDSGQELSVKARGLHSRRASGQKQVLGAVCNMGAQSLHKHRNEVSSVIL